MKKSIYLVLLAVCLAFVSASAEARDHTTRHTTTTTTTNAPVTSHMSAPERTEHHSSGISFGLGVSSITPIPQVTTGINGSLTGLLEFTNLDALQFFMEIPSTTGSFQFGIGALFKHTVFGGEGAGLHLGGGLGLGTNAAVAGSSNFAMNILGVVGVHYALANTNLLFSFDGGPVFTLQTLAGTGALGGSSTTTSFGIGALSNILGASVVYMF